MNDERHISSLLIWHRDDAKSALDACIAICPALELAARENGRCIVLCETNDQRAVLDHIDALGALPGVLNVSLVYHHAESSAEMDEPIR